MKPLNLLPSYYAEGKEKVRLAFVVHQKAEASFASDNGPILTVAVSIVRLLEDGERVRGFCGSEVFDNLIIRARAYPKFDNLPVQWELEYDNTYCLDIHKAKVKYDALRKIHGALTRLGEQFGTVKTFGQYVNRAAVVLGVEKVILYREEPRGGRGNWDDDRHYFQYWNPGEAVGAIDCRIDNWLHEQRNPTPVSENLAHCVTE